MQLIVAFWLVNNLRLLKNIVRKINCHTFLGNLRRICDLNSFQVADQYSANLVHLLLIGNTYCSGNGCLILFQYCTYFDNKWVISKFNSSTILVLKFKYFQRKANNFYQYWIFVKHYNYFLRKTFFNLILHNIGKFVNKLNISIILRHQ